MDKPLYNPYSSKVPRDTDEPDDFIDFDALPSTHDVLPPAVRQSLRGGAPAPLAMMMQPHRAGSPSVVMPAPAVTPIPRTVGERWIKDVFFCFYAPKGAQPRSGLSALVNWTVSFFKETYTHVECLFLFGGDPMDQHNWLSLAVSEKRGTGISTRTPSFYRDNRWLIIRMIHLQESQRAAMFNFAVDEARRARAYNRNGMVCTLPYVSVCAPIVRYTPGCASCTGTGPNTVFCVQLMAEMLQRVFPEAYRDLYPESLRPERFLHELRRRSQTTACILGIEAQDPVSTAGVILDAVGRDPWVAPRPLVDGGGVIPD